MLFTQTKIPDVVIIQPKRFEDDRGWFMETFNQQTFQQGLKELELEIPNPFVQDNHSCSKKGVLRGLHYQRAPFAQGKLVRVTQGAAFDVAVDIRKNSPTYGQYESVELSAQNNTMLWIPEGFAHGFIALEDNTHFLYKTTSLYSQQSEGAIKWNDPVIGIKWPLLDELLINEKDQAAPLFKDAAL